MYKDKINEIKEILRPTISIHLLISAIVLHWGTLWQKSTISLKCSRKQLLKNVYPSDKFLLFLSHPSDVQTLNADSEERKKLLFISKKCMGVVTA